MTGMKMVLTYNGRPVEKMDRELLLKFVYDLWIEKERLQAELSQFKLTRFDHINCFTGAGSPSLSNGGA